MNASGVRTRNDALPEEQQECRRIGYLLEMRWAIQSFRNKQQKPGAAAIQRSSGAVGTKRALACATQGGQSILRQVCLAGWLGTGCIGDEWGTGSITREVCNRRRTWCFRAATSSKGAARCCDACDLSAWVPPAGLGWDGKARLASPPGPSAPPPRRKCRLLCARTL